MVGCHWCEKFEDTWKKVQNKIKGVTFKKINGRENRAKAIKYGVTSYPSIVKVVGGRAELLDANSAKDRDLEKIKKFLNKCKYCNTLWLHFCRA